MRFGKVLNLRKNGSSLRKNERPEMWLEKGRFPAKSGELESL